jgi:hypothetical protein
VEEEETGEEEYGDDEGNEGEEINGEVKKSQNLPTHVDEDSVKLCRINK